MEFSEAQMQILKKYPKKPHPRTRIAYEYRVSVEDSSVIEPDLDIIFVLEDALDQLDNGISLREVQEWYNKQVSDLHSLSHMGLKKIWRRLRPGSQPVRVAPRKKKRVDADRLEEKRRKKIASEKRKIAWAQKRVKSLEGEVQNIVENRKNEDNPIFILPTDHEIFQEISLPEGLDDEELIFKPSPRQLLFLAAPQQEVLYGGAAGGGKSYALLADFARYVPFENARGLLMRRTVGELGELIWESRKLYPQLAKKLWGDEKAAKFNAQEKIWTFRSGAELRMNYLEQDKDVMQYQGHSFTWIGFDELTQYPTATAWNYLRSRLRTKDPVLKPLLSQRGTTNPGGPGHGWVKKMFIDPAPYEQEFPAMNEDGELMLVPYGDTDFPEDRWGTPMFYRRFIPAKLRDNPYLGYEYKANLLSMPEGLRRQLLEGDWTVADGAAFPEFNQRDHVCEPFEIPAGWRRFRSCDFGYSQKSASAVHWFAIDPDETLYCYRELYVKGLTGRQLSHKIQELESKKDERMSYGVLDSSCWAERGMSGPSIAEEMIQAGTRWKPSDRTKGARSAGKNRLHELLRVDEFTKKPGLIFFNNCLHIISTLEVIPVDPDGLDDIDQDYADDHDYDSVRYAALSRPKSAGIWDTFKKGGPTPVYRPADLAFGY